MNILGVRFFPWEKVQEVDNGDAEAKEGDFVIVERDGDLDAGEVVYVIKGKDRNKNLISAQRILSEAETEKLREYEASEDQALADCRRYMKQYDLSMKLVGVKFSFDGSRVVFAFTAEARVDFRQLVRELMRHFQRRVRLQQVGSRDEARERGGYGHCGEEICCRRFLREIDSISTEMAANQDLTHRGSDRLSGLCGRLLCCLGYEDKTYSEASKSFPQKGDVVYDKENKVQGVVVDRRVLEGTVFITTEDNQRREVALEQIKVLKRNRLFANNNRSNK